jgi:hypothetical protein
MSTFSDDKPLAATWKNGQVVLDEPADWPEGCRLQVAPIRQSVELVLPVRVLKECLTGIYH